jgi:hypothetical protein
MSATEAPGLKPWLRQVYPRRVLSFVSAAPHASGPRRPGRRERFDLARTVRLVARRHLSELRHVGRSLGCLPGKALTGKWDRRWSERMIGGLLSLAIQLIPEAPITLQFERLEGQAVVQASCPPFDGQTPRRRPDLARLTRAREEWQLEFWLWRAMAKSRGGDLTLVQDPCGPVGIRVSLPG